MRALRAKTFVSRPKMDRSPEMGSGSAFIVLRGQHSSCAQGDDSPPVLGLCPRLPTRSARLQRVALAPAQPPCRRRRSPEGFRLAGCPDVARRRAARLRPAGGAA